MKLLSALSLVILLNVNFIFAQNNWCGTDHYHEELIQQNPALLQITEKEQDRIFSLARQFKNNKSGNVITIPVVVHNFHDNGDGYITDKQIRDGIRVLNEDFHRLNADTSQTRSLFKPYAGKTTIQFKLATKDPNGNGSNGIVRINTTESHEADNAIKSLSRWPVNKYLNFWLVRSIESNGATGTVTLGYAQFPFFGITNTYGVVQRSDTWGTIETSFADGRTTTHEVGHCLGLFHTFQSGCGNNCNNSGDELCDTPPVKESTQGCNKSLNTCSNDATGSGSPYTSDVVNQIENYMSYDDCQNMFTKEQVDVMNQVLTSVSGLVNLVSYPNLVNTGTDSNHVPTDNPPIADFFYPEHITCEGQSVTYVDISYNGSIGTRSWSFPGGTPSSSSDSIVTVTYGQVGTYDATLTITNPQGTDSKTLKNAVEVQSSLPDHSYWFYSEGLEDSAFSNEWRVVNVGGSAKWEVTDKAAYTGNRSVYIKNYGNNQLESVDEFISPSYDLSAVRNPELFFKVAYTRRISSNDDALRVYYSVDCGNTWVIRFSKTGSSLETADGENSAFTPQGPDDWKEFRVTIPGTGQQSDNVLFKFEFTFDGGNNIFIDDIQIQNPLGLPSNDEIAVDFSIYPNPTNAVSKLSINTDKDLNNVQIDLLDIRGTTIGEGIYRSLLKSGIHQFELPLDELPQGMYFVRLTSTKGSITEKLIIR